MRRLLPSVSLSGTPDSIEPVSTEPASIKPALFIPAPIKVAGLDLQPVLTGLERAAIKATSFGLAAIAVYVWLTFIFGRFPFTRPWGDGLAEFMIGLLATFADGALQALPGFFTVLVGSPITNYSRLADERGAVVGTKVTIGYDAPWRQVHAMLTLAAERTSLVRKEPAPLVLQSALADFYPEYELIVHIDRPEQRFFALSELHGRIQDVFNEYGVQIMSPNFVSQPEQKVCVPEGRWYAAPAEPEARMLPGES
jgi:hypothetical protein